MKKWRGSYRIWVMLSLLMLVMAFSASSVFAGGNGAGGQAISVLGVAQVGGQTVFVHVWAVVPPGADANAVAAEALRGQGARPFDSDEFSTTGLVWDQFSDGSTANDFVTQNYNPGSDDTDPEPTGIDGEFALENTHATWTNVSTSKFAFDYGGTTDRCPSLVRECGGRQVFDGNNDVAWLGLNGCCTLGVAWFGTSTDEVDIALNVEFNWSTDGVSNFDVETVFLHENGHAGGLGHSDVEGAVMFPTIASGEAIRSLHQDDIDGITFLYPADTTPDPAVDIALSTDKSSYVSGTDTTAVLTAVVTDELGDAISGLDSSDFDTTLDDGTGAAAVSVTFSVTATPGTYTGSLDISLLAEDTYTVEVTVTSDALSGSDTATFSVTSPPDPAVNVSLSTDKSSYVSGTDTTAVLTAVVTDELGDAISGLGSSAFGTTLDDGTGAAAVSVTFSETATLGTYTGDLAISLLADNTYTVEVTATSDTLSGSDTASFTIGPASTFGLAVSYATEGGPNGDKHLLVTFTASLSDGSPVSGVTFSHTLNNTTTEDSWGPVTGTTGSGGTVTFKLRNAPSGTYSVTVHSASHDTLTWDGVSPSNTGDK